MLNAYVAASAAQLAATVQSGQVVVQPGQWSILSIPAANTIASATKAAGAAGVRHVAQAFTATLLNDTAVASVGRDIYIRDGATGVGTVIWCASLSVQAAAGASGWMTQSGLNIVGSPATAMNIEFSLAAGANTFERCSLAGISII